MSVGAGTEGAGVAARAAPRSITLESPSTTPTNGVPCRSNVPSLKRGADGACADSIETADPSNTTSAKFFTSGPQREAG